MHTHIRDPQLIWPVHLTISKIILHGVRKRSALCRSIFASRWSSPPPFISTRRSWYQFFIKNMVNIFS